MINRYASLRQGLVGAWCPSLGASGFRLIDRSGYGNHGTLTNMDPGTDWVGSGGKLALDFDGTNDYVVIAPSPKFDFAGDTSFSLSAWFYSRSASGIQTILNRGVLGTSARDFILYTNFTSGSNFRVEFQNSPGASFPTIVTGNLSLLTWYHVVANKGPSGASEIFINSISQVTGTLSNTVASSNLRSVVIGATFDASATQYYSSANFDDLRIFNRTLTPSEIRLLYTGGRGVGLLPERVKHRRKTTAAATNRRRRIICGANC